MSNDPTTTDPLQLDRCPECGYLLTGLPQQGVCPECGAGFDRTITIVLYGYLAGNRAQFPAASFGARIVLAIALMAGLHTLARLLPFRVSPGLLNALAGMLVGVYVWVYYRRRLVRDNLPGPVQLRLSAQGFGYRAGYGPCRLHPWKPSMRVTVKPRRRGYWRLEILDAPARTIASRYLRFHLKCDAETAGRLSEQIRTWQAAAGDG